MNKSIIQIPLKNDDIDKIIKNLCIGINPRVIPIIANIIIKIPLPMLPAPSINPVRVLVI